MNTAKNTVNVYVCDVALSEDGTFDLADAQRILVAMHEHLTEGKRKLQVQILDAATQVLNRARDQKRTMQREEVVGEIGQLIGTFKLSKEVENVLSRHTEDTKVCENPLFFSKRGAGGYFGFIADKPVPAIKK